MINMVEKSKCCGCSACAQSCPKHCINMSEDEEGFQYPQVNSNLCINCGLCEESCPIFEKKVPQIPIETVGAVNLKRSVVEKSSSGGIFSALSEHVINKGGVVFGASYNEKWDVCHSWVSDISSLNRFRGSKYVQSSIGKSYREVRDFLMKDREVLFSGTPCQVAGLKSFLKKDYEKLLTVEVACHGVPSPKVYRDYLKYVSKDRIESITEISFRNKRKGWLHYRFIINAMIKGKKKIILNEKRSDNYYMQSFLKNYNLRPSCYECSFKAGCSNADLTLADFWGVWDIAPDFFHKTGVSIILINSIKGKANVEQLDIEKIIVDYSNVVKYNSCLIHSSIKPSNRSLFWQYWQNNNRGKLHHLLRKTSLLNRIIRFFLK